jgi:hypothetical protein
VPRLQSDSHGEAFGAEEEMGWLSLRVDVRL